MAFLNWKPFLHYKSFVYRAMLCMSAVICTADALKKHERVNAFNLVSISLFFSSRLSADIGGEETVGRGHVPPNSGKNIFFSGNYHVKFGPFPFS